MPKEYAPAKCVTLLVEQVTI